MARGLQKEQSQQKAKEKLAAQAGGKSTLKADKGLKFKCPQCMQEIDSLSNCKTHWGSKHAKLTEPDWDKCKKA